ncbi:MAG: hypothetical protein AB7S38_23440 [Vulcanimicrobiota bacterium]
MRLHALYCPGCGAPINPGDAQQVTCSYCGSVLLVQRFSVRQTSPGRSGEEIQSPLPAELSQVVTGRFELSLLDQVVPGAGPEWFRPLDLGQGRFALAYLRLVDADGQSLARPSDDAFAVLTTSLQEDSDPGLAAYLLLEHLVRQGFRERVETAILLFEPARSSVVTYNAGCPGCLLWVSQEEGRTVSLGRAYEALEARMLRETRDYFSNSDRLTLAGDDLVVLVSAGYAGRGGGARPGEVMKKCPFCAEEIQDEAIKCKHCGEMLAERPDAKPQPVVENALTKHHGVKMDPDTEKKAAAGIAVFALVIFAWLGIKWAGAGIGLPSFGSFGAHQINIQVSGDAGTPFQGSYGDVNGQKSVSGTIPDNFTMDAKSVFSCSFQKQSEEGSLIVSVQSDAHQIGWQSTRAPYGVVTISNRL